MTEINTDRNMILPGPSSIELGKKIADTLNLDIVDVEYKIFIERNKITIWWYSNNWAYKIYWWTFYKCKPLSRSIWKNKNYC